MKKILIVDNDPHVRRLYELELQRTGYGTSACADSGECLRRIEKEHPDLVILDVQLREDDGLQTLQSIRYSHRALPVILNTAYADYGRNYMSYVADRCLVKNSDTSELLATVDALL